MVQLCRIICVIISVLLSWYLPGTPATQSNLGPPALWTVSLPWLRTPTRDWLWQEIVVKIIPLSPLFSDSGWAVITSFRELLRGGSFHQGHLHPILDVIIVIPSDSLIKRKLLELCQDEHEVWGAESWHLMISSFWLDPGNWLNLFQIIKTHNGKCHATEESWGAFTGLSPPLPSIREAVAKFRVSPPGRLPVLGSHGRKD